MTLTKWDDLTTAQKSEIRNAFCHWQFDTTSSSFEDWARKHAYYIRKDGRLARTPSYCEPVLGAH